VTAVTKIRRFRTLPRWKSIRLRGTGLVIPDASETRDDGVGKIAGTLRGRMSREACIFVALLLSFQAAAQNLKPVYQDPTQSQNIVQPPNTIFSANNYAGILDVVPSVMGGYSWQQSPTMPTTNKPNTPPLIIASSVPVLNLTATNHPTMQYCGTTATCSSTGMTPNGQIVFGTIPIPSGTTSVTLTGISPMFLHSFNCVANDLTNPAHGVNAVPQSGSSVLFTGPTGSGGDVISYQCVGS
jgi:hypothetical protein